MKGHQLAVPVNKKWEKYLSAGTQPFPNCSAGQPPLPHCSKYPVRMKEQAWKAVFQPCLFLTGRSCSTDLTLARQWPEPHGRPQTNPWKKGIELVARFS